MALAEAEAQRRARIAIVNILGLEWEERKNEAVSFSHWTSFTQASLVSSLDLDFSELQLRSCRLSLEPKEDCSSTVLFLPSKQYLLGFPGLPIASPLSPFQTKRSVLTLSRF